ncbi:MAG: hypothetical protein Q9217_005139 [Psora testacea]
MLSEASFLAILAAAPAALAAPAPQVAGGGSDPSVTSFGPDQQLSFSLQTPAASPYPVIVGQNGYSSATYHGPYSGTPTTTGAENAPTTLAASIAPQPLNPTATYYNTAGVPLNPMPAPYTPAGGLGTNGTLPRYMVNSDFDFESIALGLYQEWIELDLFHDGLARFSDEQFTAAGLGPEARSLIQFMADQETGHATLLTNMLGERAPKQCYYDYPYTAVREWVDFMQRLTRFGESGVWGFINHLDSREVGQLLAQSIATEARQQQIFRQMSGLQPMNVWFENGWPQSWAWTMLAQYISYCPENTTRLAWQNFPTLHILNNANINRYSPNDTAQDGSENVGSRITDPSVSNITGSCENLNVTGYGCAYDSPNQPVGPNNSYVTSTTAGAPKFVAWSQQLNLTYSPFVPTGNNTGFSYQPLGFVYGNDGIINGTMAVMLTDLDLFVTPFK